MTSFRGRRHFLSPVAVSTHPRHNRIKPTRAEASKQVSGLPIADSQRRKGNGGLISIENSEHGVGGGDPNEIEAAYRESEKFLDRFLRVSPQ